MNGIYLGGQGRRTGYLYRLFGVTPGWADLTILEPGRAGKHGLLVEFKAGRDGLTDVQEIFKEEVIARGYEYALVRTVEDFHAVLEAYLPEPTASAGPAALGSPSMPIELE